jgi:hypothetical protein
MVDVIWAPKEMPTERHIIVHSHQTGTPAADKGYFFVSDEPNWGGSGPFDMRLDEVIERAKRTAQDKGLRSVVVIRKL